jgi:putative peptidoglycan lipid II flippase
MSPTSSSQSRFAFLKTSALLNALYVLEGVASFGLDLAISAHLGLGMMSDSLYAAWSLPQTIGRGVFQSLTNSFMGLFADDDDPTLRYSQAITVIFVFGLGLAALMSLTSPLWFAWTVPGSSPQTKALGQTLSVILSWLISFLAMSETLRAVYYQHKRVVVPSFVRAATILATVLVILALPVLGYGEDLTIYAWVLVAGAALEALVGFLLLRPIIGFAYRPSWPDREHRLVMRQQVGEPLIGQGIRVVAGVVERALASFLGPGVLTAVSFSNRILFIVERFIFRGFLITTIQSFPRLTGEGIKRRLRLVLLLALPLCAGLAFLAEPLVSIAFGRGRFSAEDIATLSTMLQAYALGIAGIALTRIPFGLAFAQKQGRVVLGFFVVVSLSLIIVETALILLGLELWAFGVAFTAAIALGLAWLWRFTLVGHYDDFWTRADTLQMLALSAVVLGGTWLVVWALPPFLELGFWGDVATLIFGGATALGLLAGGAYALRVEEVRWLSTVIRERG